MIIYKIWNRINNKIYVGLTTRLLIERWKEHIKQSKGKHLSIIGRAIKKYGVENFYIEKIEECSTIEELIIREEYWIKKLDSINNGYNILPGGPETINTKTFNIWVESLDEESKQAFFHNRSKVRQGSSPFGSTRLKPKTSKFLGVKKTNAKIATFQTRIKYLGKTYSKNFSEEIEAAILYDKLALLFYGPEALINFEESKNYSREELDAAFVFLKTPYVSGSGKYRWVNYQNKFKRWCARAYYDGKVLFSVHHKNEEECYKRQQQKLKSLGYEMISGILCPISLK